MNFLGRYWVLVVLFVVSFFISWTDLAFGVAGTLIYLPVLSFGAIIVALIIRHVFFKQTLDDDAHTGYFVEQWKKLSPRERIFANLAVMAVLFIGVCMISAALIK